MNELEGLREAAAPPGQHTCAGKLVDATIAGERLILICFACSTYWLTGVREQNYISTAALIRSANKLYGMTGDARKAALRQMAKVDTGRLMELYRRGLGCYRIGKMCGMSRQAVHERLRRAGAKMRPRHKYLKPKVAFNGSVYTWSSKGYYRRTSEPRTILHHDIWEFHHGPIPDGYEVRHRDRDQHNNDISNLVCVTKADSTRMHHPRRRLPRKWCLFCGEELKPKPKQWRSKKFWETPNAFGKRLYCNPRCAKAHARGKPRGWSPNREAEASSTNAQPGGGTSNSEFSPPGQRGISCSREAAK